MLYERWRQIARDFSGEIALRDLPSGRQWTFSQLDAAAAQPNSTEPFVFARGNTAEFVIAVLQAWRHGKVVCPLESSQPVPAIAPPPLGIVHLKTTSATSGSPKLIAFTAEQLAADADNIVATMGLRRSWPNLAFISLAHSYGFSNLVTPLLLHGVPLMLGGMPLPEIVRAAAANFEEVTLPAVPALWRAWSEAGAIPASVRLAISAGAPLPLTLEREVWERYRVKIHNFYGASECGGIAYDTTETPRDDAGVVGAPMRNVDLSVNGNGCLEVRGASVGEGYYPEAANGLGRGVYVTTDLAEIRDGKVFLRGRASEVINVAGRKVSPESIERVLARHPAVRDCVVFGVPGPESHRGETIVACVVRRSSASSEDLRQFVASQGDSWQAPREFWFIDSLEVNERGKLSRAEWRTRFLRQRGQTD